METAHTCCPLCRHEMDTTTYLVYGGMHALVFLNRASMVVLRDLPHSGDPLMLLL
jgi:hypothetical protein